MVKEADFDFYEKEDDQYRRSVDEVEESLGGLGFSVINLPKQFLATYDFRHTSLVVVIGPDGLVANTAKYVGDLPIVAINPDPQSIDGKLLPFKVGQARTVVQRTLDQKTRSAQITLARVDLSDGQSMLAFNDFFIGRRSHTSARYVLYSDRESEVHSSSGVIVSTGAGATGWLSSVFNMSAGVTQWIGGEEGAAPSLDWEDRRLAWIVREPFVSRTTKAGLVAGMIDEAKTIRIESLMPEHGVIFSDGIESDFLEFNSGAIADLSVASQRTRLVVPD